MGRALRVRLSGRRDQRAARRLAALRRGQDPLRAGAPRGNGRLHGVGLRKIHRRAGRVHRDVGPRRVASDHRTLRRADGSHARAGDRRAAGARRGGRPLPAGAGPRQHVQGRGRRVRAAGEHAAAGAPSGRPRRPHRAGRAPRYRAGISQRPAGAAVRGAAAQARHAAFRRGLREAEGGAVRCRSAARGRGAERRQEGRDPGRRRRAARDRRGDRGRRPARRGRRQGAAGQGACCRTSCPG